MNGLWLFLNSHLQLFDYAVLLTGRALFRKRIYRLCNHSSDLRSNLVMISHSSRCKVIRAQMWRRGLRATAYECGSLKASTLTLKIEFLNLFLWPRYLNWRGYNVRVLHRHGMNSRVNYFIACSHVLLRPMWAVSHVVNPQIRRYIVHIVNRYVCLLFTGTTPQLLLIPLLSISRLLHLNDSSAH